MEALIFLYPISYSLEAPPFAFVFIRLLVHRKVIPSLTLSFFIVLFQSFYNSLGIFFSLSFGARLRFTGMIISKFFKIKFINTF